MPTTLDNLLDQSLDIAGTLFQTDSLLISDESKMLGREVVGQSGVAASILGTNPNILLSGLSGCTSESVGRFITIYGAASSVNNGTFLITEYVNPTSVIISNYSGVSGDVNNGGIIWVERYPWSSEDDHNYHRTDRAAIKGVSYDSEVPGYYKCTDLMNQVPANLFNIAGKTTDAKSLIYQRKFPNINPIVGDGFVVLSDVGNLKHSDFVDSSGVPIFDGFDIGDNESTYAEVVDGYGSTLYVLSGSYAGNRIFGRMRAGSSISPDSVEMEWRSVALGDSIDNSVSYTWEMRNIPGIDIYYPYRECLDTLPENAFRNLLINGLVSGSSNSSDSLVGKLANITSYFPFYNLPNSIPTVADALNTLNDQIGDRCYQGEILTDGYTITESLQQLSDAIESGGQALPQANYVGQLLFSVDGEKFVRCMPVTTDYGWIVNDFGLMVVNVDPEDDI